jgi:TonB-dependent SusC/RagA subfamily outer membrane receptor
MYIGERFKYSLPTVFLFLFLTTAGYAQQTMVKGTVKEKSNGKALPGVNILVKGTSQGTSSDKNGKYTLSVPSKNDTLVFSFVGFKTQTIPVNGRSTINVSMATQTTKGKELVVVGYGTQQKGNLTTSITSVDSSQITEEQSLTATGALQGKVSGVNIIQNHAPGGSPSVIMRGLGTALGGRNPLYIVDGVPTDNINNIAPSDIKSMSFLKGASAASIYGLRAANGVIIVKTKNGRKGKPTFSVKAIPDIKVFYTG